MKIEHEYIYPWDSYAVAQVLGVTGRYYVIRVLRAKKDEYEGYQFLTPDFKDLGDDLHYIGITDLDLIVARYEEEKEEPQDEPDEP